jgi:hypothetical protein
VFECNRHPEPLGAAGYKQVAQVGEDQQSEVPFVLGPAV